MLGLEDLKAMLKHEKEKYCLKINILKYIKKHGKEEVQEILNKVKQG